MPTDNSIREFLLDPAIAGTLSAPLDRFVLHAKDGDIELAAHLRCNSEGKGFILEFRDDEGRDISEFFEKKAHYSDGDGITADGWLDGRFPIEFSRLFRPGKSTQTLIGIPKSSRATFRPSKIRIPPDHTDHLPDELDSTAEAGGSRPYSHFAIFRNTKLIMVNKGVKEKRLHPFVGETSTEREEVWISEALGGEYCLHQAGDHLEIHFRHKADTDEEAMTQFWCLIDAVSLIHAILPWPTYRQHRRDGTLLERELALHGAMPQGRFVPFRKSDTYGNSSAGSLLASLALLLSDSPKVHRQRLRRLLWVYRGSVQTHMLQAKPPAPGGKPAKAERAPAILAPSLELLAASDHHPSPKRLFQNSPWRVPGFPTTGRWSALLWSPTTLKGAWETPEVWRDSARPVDWRLERR